MSKLVVLAFSVLRILVNVLEQVHASPLPVATTSKATKQDKGKAASKVRVDKRTKGTFNNVNVNTIAFKDLVNLRPSKINSVDGLQYKDLFSKHAEIQKINLNDSTTGKIAQSFLDLKSDEKHGSKMKLTASIQDYLKEVTLFKNEANREELLAFINGKRYTSNTKQRRQKYVEKKGKKKLAEENKIFLDKFQKENGIQYRASREIAKVEDPFLNQSLSFHLDHLRKSFNALQMEQYSRNLSKFYSTNSHLTKELERYLKSKNTPLEEMDAAMTMRASTVANLERERRKMGRQKKGGAILSSQTSTSSGFGQGNHQFMQPIQPPQVYVDPNNKAEWDWLSYYLNS